MRSRLPRSGSRRPGALAGCKSSGGGALPTAVTRAARELPAADDLISDFDTDNSLSPVDGRQGGWYTYGDDIGTFADRRIERLRHRVDEGNPTCSPNGSLHVKGTGFAHVGRRDGRRLEAAPVRRRRRLRRQDDVRREPATAASRSGRRRRRPSTAFRSASPTSTRTAARPPHDMPDPTDSSRPPLCTDCQLHLQRRLPVQLQPVPGAVRPQGRRGRGRALLGLLELPARHDLEALSGAVRRHEAGPRQRRLPHRRPTA